MIKQPKDYWEPERVDVISKMDDFKAIKEELEERYARRLFIFSLVCIGILMPIISYILMA